MIWKPNVTVAAVIEREGKFLLVEEDQQDLGVQLNQPAGHLEPLESIIQGCIRETLEETAYTFQPQWLIGIYQWHSSVMDTTYLRFALSGLVTDFDENRKLFNEYYITIEKSNVKFIYDELSMFDYKNDLCYILSNIK